MLERGCQRLTEPLNLDQFKLLGWYKCWYGPVSVLLAPEVNKVGSNGCVLAGGQLLEADLRCQMLIGHLLPHSPAHVHNLSRQNKKQKRKGNAYCLSSYSVSIIQLGRGGVQGFAAHRKVQLAQFFES